MSVLADLTDEERYLYAILQDASGIDQAEFTWVDETSPDNLFRCYDYQYPWYRDRSKLQIDQCVAEGELVLTRRGHVPIEDVVIGDEVWTHRDRWRKVTYAWDKGPQDVVRVTNPGNTLGLLLTPDHKMYTREAIRRMRGGTRFVDMAEPAFKAPETFLLRSGERRATMVASPYRFGESATVPEIQRLSNCAHKTLPTRSDVNFLWLCGVYVAEGSVHAGANKVPLSTYLSLHRSEVEQVVKTAEACGLSPLVLKTKNPSVRVVSLPGKSLATWLVEHFGKLAYGKRLPIWALSLPVPLRQALLDGLLYGDGHLRVSRRDDSKVVAEYITVSKALAFDVRLLVQSLGRGSTVSLRRSAGQMVIEGRMVATRDTYGVSVAVEDPKKTRIQIEEHVWGSFYAIEPAGRANVFDIEVEEDHSFVVNGQVVKNCGRAVGKSVGMQMRSWAFPFTNPGEQMLLTAPEMIHLDPVTKLVEDRILNIRMSREFLKKTGTGNGITHRPFEAQFRNGARIVGRIPQKDGKGVKGQHPKKLEMDEGQDYPEPGWVELFETLKYGDEDATWRTHGVSRGIRDRYYKQTQPEAGWKVHRITGMHRGDWTPEEREAKAELYGSRDHPDYRRNILGLHGDAQSALFVLSRLMECVDQNKDSFYNTTEYMNYRITDERLRDSGLEIEELLDFPAIHKAYERVWVGMDVGLTNHPSEIMIFAEDYPKEKSTKRDVANMRLKLIARIHLERISSPDQRQVLEKVWDFYRPQAIAMDSTGLGLPIFQEITTPGKTGYNPSFARVMRGYNFSRKILVGYEEQENPDWDEDRKPIEANVLEYSSDMLRVFVDQKQVWLPWDIDLIREFQGQTYVISKSNTDAYGRKRFNLGKFHALDGVRMALLGHLQETIDNMARIQDDDPVMDMFLV